VCFHKKCKLLSYTQYWAWITIALPGVVKIFMIGLVVVCAGQSGKVEIGSALRKNS
jgi:hypothetical protein